MNDIKKYFVSGSTCVLSPTKMSPNMISSVGNSHVLSQDSLIVSTMESVIDSVSKKKRNRKKRKQSSRVEPEISDISNILNNSLCFVSSEATVEILDSAVEEYLSDTSANNNQFKTLTRNEEKLQFKFVTKKPQISKPEKSKLLPQSQPQLQSQPKVSPELARLPIDDCILDNKENGLTKNAFSVMMSARQTNIGSNSPGRELQIPTETNGEDTAKIENKTKRRTELQAWADRKGGLKRRLHEEMEEECIKQKLDKRAKRLKSLLTNDSLDISKTKRRRSVKKQINSTMELSIKKDTTEHNAGSSAMSSSFSEFYEAPTVELNEVNNSFVLQLNSPTKKKDSLLGYFVKTSSIPEAELLIVDEPETGSFKEVNSQKSKSKVAKEINDLKNLADVAVVSKKRSSYRRVCTNKVNSRDASAEGADLKLPKKNSRKISLSHDDQMETVILIEDVSPKGPTKLAPLFLKTIPKPAVDPILVRARKDFLMSGIPDKMKLVIEKRKVYIETIESNVYPMVSHIFQWSNVEQSNYKELINDSSNCDYHHLDEDNTIISSPKLGNSYLLKLSDLNVMPAKRLLLQYNSLAELKNFKLIAKQLKCEYGNFPFIRCCNQLRAKYRKEKHANRLTENEDTVTEISCKNGNILFTEKYKASCIDEILVNSRPCTELKEFLSAWSDDPYLRGKNQKDSDNEFEMSQNSNSNHSPDCNTVLLIGPPGCGKTSSVYALADEMNFKVLEINGGMRRTGKKILHELQEATQSHRVRKQESNAKTQVEEELTASGDNKSLILIEDADLVLEQDDGFIAAISQLVATSKRPVILVYNSITPVLSSKFGMQNMITFNAPNALAMPKWLSVMALCENAPMNIDVISELFKYRHFDVRRTMLEMQFFIQSGGDCKRQSLKETHDTNALEVIKHTELFAFFTKDQNEQTFISFPIDFDTLWCNLPSMIGQSQTVDDDSNNFTAMPPKSQDNTLDEIALVYENISFAQNMSTQLRSDDDECFSVNRLRDDISKELVQRSMTLNRDSITSKYNLLKRRNWQIKSNQLFTAINSGTLNERSGYLDYEPILRAICRSEQGRVQTERKSCRFYHYLRNFPCTSFSNKLFDKHCAIFDTERIDK